MATRGRAGGPAAARGSIGSIGRDKPEEKLMLSTCVCLEQLEHRAFLAAGFVDGSYSSAFRDDFVQGDTEPKVAMHVDNKTIHYIGLHGQPTIWREDSDGSLDRRFGLNGK